jgi:alkyl hydroperoxide reductase subunit AhpC
LHASIERLAKPKMLIRYVTKNIFLIDNMQILKLMISTGETYSMIGEDITRLIKSTQSVSITEAIMAALDRDREWPDWD